MTDRRKEYDAWLERQPPEVHAMTVTHRLDAFLKAHPLPPCPSDDCLDPCEQMRVLRKRASVLP